MLQNNNVGTDVKGITMVSVVFLNVFGQDAMPKLMGRGFNLQKAKDKMIFQGMMQGGNECLEWCRNGQPVMGWAKYANGQYC